MGAAILLPLKTKLIGERTMSKTFGLITAVALLAMPCSASASEFSAAEIAKLPQEKVAAVKRDCASTWQDDFRMRLYCEDKQFKAMQQLIDRGSIKPTGDRL
ncbi:hypothetical protein [Bradyrhizobium neotropicale]|uniref:hypothetical protein n=1 Tax=Bradyrhizobium neotropicale TaxID=1497615 RepID=UPI001AD61EF7|nr:hypothetical protein [Bradyrhizobium neotropicale]MBO4221974.1 hypothetical protein [Bradyrhizobium neotropicale]